LLFGRVENVEIAWQWMPYVVLELGQSHND